MGKQTERHDQLMLPGAINVLLPEACVPERPQTSLEDINNQLLNLFLGLLIPIFIISKHCSKSMPGLYFYF